MTPLTRLYGAILLVLMTVLVAVTPSALAQGGAPVAARTISNVATIEWEQGAGRLALASKAIAPSP